jgi:hypothetical protein
MKLHNNYIRACRWNIPHAIGFQACNSRSAAGFGMRSYLC